MRYNNSDFFPGIWRAKVIDNKDEKKLGRVLIEFLLYDDVSNKLTLWAFPANNTIGGRSKDSLEPFGSVMIPPKESYVYIFFEGGLIDRPRYMSGMDINFGDMLPENVVGEEYWNKWTIMRTPKGRTIILSDDPSDERTEITGKKRKELDKENPEENVYDIDENQSVVLIDDRDGEEKILIKDYKGNYIKLNTRDNKIEIECIDNYNLKVGGNVNIISKQVNVSCEDLNVDGSNKVNISCGSNANIKAGDNTNIEASSNVNIKAGGNVNIDGSNIMLNCSASSSAEGTNGSPEEPNGDRDSGGE